jgi:hypothetical protein
MSPPDLFCVNPEQIFDFWPHARGLIKSAIDATDLSDFADIEHQVLNGDQLLWLAWSGKIEAAATTHLSRNVCTLTALASDKPGHGEPLWRRAGMWPLFERIEQYARNEGCKMRIYGRPGWQRVLDGYKIEHVILEKAL